MEQTYNYSGEKIFEYQLTRSRSVPAQLRGIKKQILYFPEETTGYWNLKMQVWQGEFFKWLKETL
jgi:hypothetical protein